MSVIQLYNMVKVTATMDTCGVMSVIQLYNMVKVTATMEHLWGNISNTVL